MASKFNTFLQNDDGATAIEYCMIAAAMCIALIAAMPLIANPLSAKLVSIAPGILNGK
jgi:Flp pilus assembly pilin Flp